MTVKLIYILTQGEIALMEMFENISYLILFENCSVPYTFLEFYCSLDIILILDFMADLKNRINFS